MVYVINLGLKIVKNHQKVALEKVDGSRFFWSKFNDFYLYKHLLGFIEKQAPQKALCLGPDPPLAKSGFFNKFNDFS
jgi:hypothetical protein